MEDDSRQTKKRHATSPNNDDIVQSKKPRLPAAIGKNNQAQAGCSMSIDDNTEDEQTYAASGLKHTLHGNIFQLNLLLLFLVRGLRKSYDFWLATEMDAAEKFDDVVFRYADKQCSEPKQKCRYLQAKHRQDELNIKICPSNLMNESDHDFSLQKYFISYRKITNHPELTKSELQDIIVWTNIGFDRKKLHDEQIVLDRVMEKDDLLHTESVKHTELYTINIPESSRLHKILRNSSDADILARTLAQHLFNGSKLTLQTKIFKLYHLALVSEKVVDKDAKWLSDKFINEHTTLSANAQKFRNTFLSKVYEMKGVKRNYQFPRSVEILLPGNRSRPEFSDTFGKEFKPLANPKLSNVGLFTEAFLRLIRDNENKRVKIDRTVYKSTAAAGSDEAVIGTDIDKLAGHVLIAENETFRFSSDFLKGNTVSDDIKTFRNEIEIALGNQYNDLAQYQFEIMESEHWNQMHAKIKLPEFGSGSTTTEIKNFSNKLIFAVNQLNEVQLGEFITHEISTVYKINRLEAGLFSDVLHRELLHWFKKKGPEKGREGEYLTTKRAEDMINSIKQRIDTTYFLRKSLGCLERLQEYKLEFKNEYQELQNLLSPSGNHDVQNNRVLNIHAPEEILPTVIRVHQTIRKTEGYTDNNSMIFMLMSQNFSSVTNNMITHAFESEHSPDLFVLEYGTADQKELQELCEKLRKTIEKNKKKKLIIITKSSNQLNQDYGCNKVECRNSSFNDLSEASQERLLTQASINFQGKPGMSFQELCGEFQSTEFGHVTDSSTFVKLIRNEEISVGNTLKTLHFYKNDGFPHQQSPATTTIDHNDRKKVVIKTRKTTIIVRTALTIETEEKHSETWAKEMKEKNSKTWVIRINLFNFTTELNDELRFGSRSKDNINKAINFFVTNLSGLKTEFEKQVLKKVIRNTAAGGKIALLFHGLAEIHDDHHNQVIDMLKSLEKLETVHLHVITTEKMARLLKKELDIHSQFSDNQEDDFGVTNNHSSSGLDQ